MAEDEKERLDRELMELLNELRVVLPGIQVLFAFLLVVPFNQAFQNVSEIDRYVYFAALLATAAASVLFIAPSSYHRIQFRRSDKERLIHTSNRLAIAGSLLLGLAISLTVFLVGDFLFGGLVGIVSAGATAAWLVWFWYGLPLSRRAQEDRDRGARRG